MYTVSAQLEEYILFNFSLLLILILICIQLWYRVRTTHKTQANRSYTIHMI